MCSRRRLSGRFVLFSASGTRGNGGRATCRGKAHSTIPGVGRIRVASRAIALPEESWPKPTEHALLLLTAGAVREYGTGRLLHQRCLPPLRHARHHTMLMLACNALGACVPGADMKRCLGLILTTKTALVAGADFGKLGISGGERGRKQCGSSTSGKGRRGVANFRYKYCSRRFEGRWWDPGEGQTTPFYAGRSGGRLLRRPQLRRHVLAGGTAWRGRSRPSSSHGKRFDSREEEEEEEGAWFCVRELEFDYSNSLSSLAR